MNKITRFFGWPEVNLYESHFLLSFRILSIWIIIHKNAFRFQGTVSWKACSIKTTDFLGVLQSDHVLAGL